MGLRIGEASALSTHNIDLGNKRLHICRTLTTDKDWKVIMGNKTKTYAGNRTLPIPDFLLPYIISIQTFILTKNMKEEKTNY